MCERLQEFFKLTKMDKSIVIQQVGCSRSMLYYIINGSRTPSPKLARKLIKLTRGFVRYEDFYKD
jgi:DNA-binding XRE family transcriptional regulator